MLPDQTGDFSLAGFLRNGEGLTMQIAANRQYSVRLQESGVLVLETAELLSRLLGNAAEEKASLVSRIGKIERCGGDLTHSLTNQLNRAAIKPLDIKLVGDLSKALNGILRSLAEASSKFTLYKIREPFPFTVQISETIFEQSRELLAALMAVINGGHALDHCAEIIRLGSELKRLRETSLMNLFDSVGDPVEVVKRKGIIDSLARAAEKVRDFARFIESTAQVNDRACARIAR